MCVHNGCWGVPGPVAHIQGGKHREDVSISESKSKLCGERDTIPFLHQLLPQEKKAVPDGGIDHREEREHVSREQATDLGEVAQACDIVSRGVLHRRSGTGLMTDQFCFLFLESTSYSLGKR